MGISIFIRMLRHHEVFLEESVVIEQVIDFGLESVNPGS